ncbi:MarR family transcriptional regulator [Saccharopolyspora shandongensis]|uniref:MarR family transcriptional regulator n=1 Tax=Saccharopolyspora shandongensis TaxID=418495 RepID=UPI0033E72731
MVGRARHRKSIADGVGGLEVEDVDAVVDAVVTASRVLVAVSARSVASVDESITLPQLRALVLLSSCGPLTISGLAEQLGVNPSTATRMAGRLAAARLVKRRYNPRSRREIVVSLTRSGAEAVERVTERRRAEIARVVCRMPAETRAGLVRALTAFAEASGEPSARISPFADPGLP